MKLLKTFGLENENEIFFNIFISLSKTLTISLFGNQLPDCGTKERVLFYYEDTITIKKIYCHCSVWVWNYVKIFCHYEFFCSGRVNPRPRGSSQGKKSSGQEGVRAKVLRRESNQLCEGVRWVVFDRETIHA